MAETTYPEHAEKLGKIYQPKMREILENIRKEALERGFICDEPFDMTDECYRWSVLIQPAGSAPGDEVGVDVTIQMAESVAYEGDESGVNFMLDLVEYGGVIVGGFAPFNYTSNCWVEVDDAKAVQERWEIFARGFDPNAVLNTIQRHYEKPA